ncbi:hypothetical protein [Thermogemmatispora sp.]|uniref:hypothetical protein n=1 Tax=Thermogemmatispora sp. TaxID=1968838 RepID=UPI0035E45955
MEYQRGELVGYEVRQYLLEQWGRRCVCTAALRTCRWSWSTAFRSREAALIG